MKKNIVFFIIVLNTIISYGQEGSENYIPSTYTMKINYITGCSVAPELNLFTTYTVKGNYSVIDEINTTCSEVNNLLPNISVNNNEFIFTKKIYDNRICSGYGTVYSRKATTSELIKEPFLWVDCFGEIDIQEFYPNNIYIQKVNNNNANICSGEMLNLLAFPSNFDDAAYHWQVSVNNQVSWEDVPMTSTSGMKINDRSITNFSIEDALGENHKQYFGRQIYFRLGYAHRAFTNSIALNYSSCAPILVDVEYENPLCNGYKVDNVIAYFDRQLELNEILNPIQVIPYPKKNGDTPVLVQLNSVQSLEFDAIRQLYKYTLTNPLSNSLINGKTYTVEYQAIKESKPRGTFSSNDYFTFIDPDPLKFTVSSLNPLCHDGSTTISIVAQGGSGEYFYQINGGIKVAFDADTTPDIQEIEMQITDNNKELEIKVTDANDCIEK